MAESPLKLGDSIINRPSIQQLKIIWIESPLKYSTTIDLTIRPNIQQFQHNLAESPLKLGDLTTINSRMIRLNIQYQTLKHTQSCNSVNPKSHSKVHPFTSQHAGKQNTTAHNSNNLRRNVKPSPSHAILFSFFHPTTLS